MSQEVTTEPKTITSILSQDVLLEIFQLVVEPDLIENMSPLLLGSVCKTWRDMAWLHPPLWRNLYIAPWQLEEDFTETMIMGWLERAGNQPLDITLVGGKIMLACSDMHWQKYAYRKVIPGWEPSEVICDRLLLAAPRWRTFTAVGGPFENLRLRLEQRNYEFSILQWVFFDGSFESSKHWNFSSAPSFESFWQEGFADASAYSVPWRECWNITANFKIKHCLSVLREASSSTDLREADLTFMESWRPDAFHVGESPILLPHLTKLALRHGEFAPASEFSGFFDCVDLPALTTLKLYASRLRNSDIFSSHFISFLQRSGCQITNFTLRSPPEDSARVDLANILRQMPLLEYLDLESPDVDLFYDPLLDILRSTDERDCLPRLRTIIYSGNFMPDPAEMIHALTRRLLQAAPHQRSKSKKISKKIASSSESLQAQPLPPPPPSAIVKLKKLTIYCASTDWYHVLDTDVHSLRKILKALKKLSSSHGATLNLTWDYPVDIEKASSPPRRRWIQVSREEYGCKPEPE